MISRRFPARSGPITKRRKGESSSPRSWTTSCYSTAWWMSLSEQPCLRAEELISTYQSYYECRSSVNRTAAVTIESESRRDLDRHLVGAGSERFFVWRRVGRQCRSWRRMRYPSGSVMTSCSTGTSVPPVRYVFVSSGITKLAPARMRRLWASSMSGSVICGLMPRP